MDFSYEVVRLWERPAEELLAADLGVVPLAMLGRLSAGLSLEDGLTSVAQRVVERLINEAPPTAFGGPEAEPFVAIASKLLSALETVPR